MRARWLVLAGLLALGPASATHTPAGQEQELLPPDEAFAFSAEGTGPDTITARWEIHEGYYLYRDKLRFKSETGGVALGEAKIPEGKVKEDEFFGKVQIFREQVAVEVPVAEGAGPGDTVELTAAFQGCADLGVCYPPQTKTVTITLPERAAGGGDGQQAIERLSQLGQQLGAGGGELLEPDKAFAFSAEVIDPHTVEARWAIAEGYYMYRDKFRFAVRDAQGMTIANVALPAGKIKEDEFFGKVEIYRGQVTARIALERQTTRAASATLETGFQGCADQGVCYPPMTRTAALSLPAAVQAGAGPGAPAGAGGGGDAAPPGGPPVSEQDRLARTLAEGNLWIILPVFAGLGLLLAFTPCVFPMIPILASIIVGQGKRLTLKRAFALSLVFVLAMAVTYTVAGVIAGLFGQNLQATFQDPWIISAFVAVFVLLALSMFGFYELQLPSSWQSKLTEITNRQQGGTLAGVAVMGFLSALIVGPCVAPPLAAALIYIGTSGDPVMGGTALFSMSMGMGAPLLVVGTLGGELLPRAGGWMNAVKAVFGVLLLAVAIYLLERIVPATVTMLLWALLLIVSAIYMGALDRLPEAASSWRRLWKGLGVVLLVFGALELIGVAAGGHDYLQPLRGTPLMAGRTVPGTPGGGGTPGGEAQFQRVQTLEEIQQAIARADKPVMLDLYADWCVTCKEMEKYTFPAPGVQRAFASMLLLKADVTENDAADKAILKHFNLIGPPTYMFFAPGGGELEGYRVVGYMGAEEFQAHLDQVIARARREDRVARME